MSTFNLPSLSSLTNSLNTFTNTINSYATMTASVTITDLQNIQTTYNQLVLFFYQSFIVYNNSGFVGSGVVINNSLPPGPPYSLDVPYTTLLNEATAVINFVVSDQTTVNQYINLFNQFFTLITVTFPTVLTSGLLGIVTGFNNQFNAYVAVYNTTKIINMNLVALINVFDEVYNYAINLITVYGDANQLAIDIGYKGSSDPNFVTNYTSGGIPLYSQIFATYFNVMLANGIIPTNDTTFIRTYVFYKCLEINYDQTLILLSKIRAIIGFVQQDISQDVRSLVDTHANDNVGSAGLLANTYVNVGTYDQITSYITVLNNALAQLFSVYQLTAYVYAASTSLTPTFNLNYYTNAQFNYQDYQQALSISTTAAALYLQSNYYIITSITSGANLEYTYNNIVFDTQVTYVNINNIPLVSFNYIITINANLSILNNEISQIQTDRNATTVLANNKTTITNTLQTNVTSVGSQYATSLQSDTFIDVTSTAIDDVLLQEYQNYLITITNLRQQINMNVNNAIALIEQTVVENDNFVSIYTQSASFKTTQINQWLINNGN